MLEQIFEMFTQIRGQGIPSGLGIGLTLVKRLVELHGGTIRAESAGLDLGSRFCIRLPAMQLAAYSKEKLPGDGVASLIKTGERHRILIVDDNEDGLTSLGMLIRVLGHEVCTARDGVQAIEAAERFRPAIVLMDIGMPNLNGYEAAQHIRAQAWGAEMVLVATTGWGQEEDRRRSKAAGFDHHLVKPVELARLQEILLARSSMNGSAQAAALQSAAVGVTGSIASRDAQQAESTIANDGAYRRVAVPK
jgi:CheY-like chemotaxis protein